MPVCLFYTTTCSCTTFLPFGGTFNTIRLQEFVPTQSSIVSIDIELVSLALASANPITVNLKNGGGPTGAIIGTTTTHTGLPPAGGGFGSVAVAHFDFASPITLTPGNLYTIELVVNDGSSEFSWAANDGDPYPLGASWAVTGLGQIVGPGSFSDFTLKTYFPSQLVGGEYFTLDKAVLLVAGLQTNLAWIIPVLSAAGIGAFILRKKF